MCLEREPTKSTTDEIVEWKTESVNAKATLTLFLSIAVQIRSVTICDDPDKTAHDLRNFLESRYAASNEQAEQNLRVQLEKLVYVEGTDWDKHLNESAALSLS